MMASSPQQETGWDWRDGVEVVSERVDEWEVGNKKGSQTSDGEKYNDIMVASNRSS
jgi:hypothetical protein